jgi:hypothetical protein
MKKILALLAFLAFTGGGALAADKILKGDQFVVAGVNFPQPFQTPSGQVLKAGVYDLKVVSEGTDRVLIGLLKGGKQVGQLQGTIVEGGILYHPPGVVGPSGATMPTPANKVAPGNPGKALPVDQGVKIQPAGGPGMALPVDQGIKLQPTPRGGKAFHDLGFTPASPVSFGGGSGKISCSLNFHPGSPNRPYIEFDFLPDTQKK